MKILLERGDVKSDLSDWYGKTPLSYAAESGHDGIVKALQERGDVDSESSDEIPRTPLPGPSGPLKHRITAIRQHPRRVRRKFSPPT